MLLSAGGHLSTTHNAKPSVGKVQPEKAMKSTRQRPRQEKNEDPPTRAARKGENYDDANPTPVPIASKTKLFAVCASVNSCILGYDVGVGCQVGKEVQAEFLLSDLERGIYIGSFNFSIAVAALISPLINDRYGRRATFAASASIFLLGLVLTASAPSFSYLMVGRTIAGLGAGIGVGVSSLLSFWTLWLVATGLTISYYCGFLVGSSLYC